MLTERREIAAIYLVAGMACGVLGGGQLFPQFGTLLGDTMASVILASSGMTVAALMLELVAGFRRRA